MVDKDDLRALAMSLEGTQEAPHHAQTAYKAGRIYATIDKAGETLNLALSPDEQAMKVEMAPEIFSPVAGKWGQTGWTQVGLALLERDELEQVLRMAWSHAHRRPALSSRRHTSNRIGPKQ